MVDKNKNNYTESLQTFCKPSFKIIKNKKNNVFKMPIDIFFLTFCDEKLLVTLFK